MIPERPEQDYQLDDLVRDQRLQMLGVAGLILAVILYQALGGSLPGPPAGAAGVAPIGSG